MPKGRENDDVLLLKVQAKWYKAHVDPSLNIEQVTSEKRGAKSASSEGPLEPSTRSPTSSQRRPANEGRRSDYVGSNYTTFFQKQNFNTAVDVMLHIIFILTAMMAMQPFSLIIALRASRYACFIGFSMHLSRILHRVGTIHRLDGPSLYAWIQMALSDSEFSYILMTMLIMIQPGMSLLLSSMLVSTSVRLIDMMELVLSPGAWRAVKSSRWFFTVRHSLESALVVAALIEISCAGIIALSFLKLGLRTMTPMFIYAQVLRRQYWSAQVRSYHRAAWGMLNRFFRPFINSFPMLQRLVSRGEMWFASAG